MERKGNIDFSEEAEATKLRKNYLGSKCTQEDRMACGKMLYNVLLGATPNPCTELYLEREREYCWKLLTEEIQGKIQYRQGRDIFVLSLNRCLMTYKGLVFRKKYTPAINSEEL